jgi:hypothetical protein
MRFTSNLQLTNRNVFQLICTGSLMALVLSAAVLPANAQSSAYVDNFANSASIEGSWIFNIDVLLDQQTVATFNSLISFGGGGILVTTPSAPPMATFYGTWKCKKSGNCEAVFDAFGANSTLQRLSLRLHLTGANSLAGTGVGANCDLQGENCVDQPGGFQFTGKRIGLTSE